MLIFVLKEAIASPMLQPGAEWDLNRQGNGQAKLKIP